MAVEIYIEKISMSAVVFVKNKLNEEILIQCSESIYKLEFKKKKKLNNKNLQH